MELIVLQQGETQVKESLWAVPLQEVLEALPATQACLACFILLVKEELGNHSSVSETGELTLEMRAWPELQVGGGSSLGVMQSSGNYDHLTHIDYFSADVTLLI